MMTIAQIDCGDGADRPPSWISHVLVAGGVRRGTGLKTGAAGRRGFLTTGVPPPVVPDPGVAGVAAPGVNAGAVGMGAAAVGTTVGGTPGVRNPRLPAAPVLSPVPRLTPPATSTWLMQDGGRSAPSPQSIWAIVIVLTALAGASLHRWHRRRYDRAD